ncbi:MAG: TolC family protein [Porphyromonas sp.]|nr:TolC family protein [Porphyromonas sp.]
MKTIIYTASLVLSLTTATVPAQDIYDPVLNSIEQKSKTLKTLQQRHLAQRIANKTGLTPSNPDVEWGYFGGHPSELGIKQVLSVKQSLDFPTVYLHKKKLSDTQNRKAEYEYRLQRMELMLSAKKLCIELIRYNSLTRLYNNLAENARRIAEAYDKMHKSGSVNILEYNKAMLNLTNVENKLRLLDLEKETLLSELAVLNGGEKIGFDHAVFPSIGSLPDFESYYSEAEQGSPVLLLQKEEEEVDERRLRLTKSETLPKLAIGYMGEFVTGERFQGITVGVSIPLWENKNRIREAKAGLLATRSATREIKTEHLHYHRNLHSRARMLLQNIERYNTALSSNRNDTLLFKAYSEGEISLLTYLLEVEYFFEAYEEKLNTERDLALVQAELTAYRL